MLTINKYVSLLLGFFIPSLNYFLDSFFCSFFLFLFHSLKSALKLNINVALELHPVGIRFWRCLISLLWLAASDQSMKMVKNLHLISLSENERKINNYLIFELVCYLFDDDSGGFDGGGANLMPPGGGGNAPVAPVRVRRVDSDPSFFCKLHKNSHFK